MSRAHIMVIAKNSGRNSDLNIAKVIEATSPGRGQGDFEVEEVADLADLDIGVRRALSRYAQRVGDKKARAGTIDIVAHGSPGVMMIGPADHDELWAGTIAQLSAIGKAEPLGVRLLGCDTGVSQSGMLHERQGPVTMLAIAHYLKCPAMGMRTVLQAKDFGPTGVHEEAVAGDRSWWIDPDSSTPDFGEASRVQPKFKRGAGRTDEWRWDREVRLGTSGGARVQVKSRHLLEVFSPAAVDAPGLLYRASAWGTVRLGSRRTRIEVLGAGEFLRIGGPSGSVHRRTGGQAKVSALLRGESSWFEGGDKRDGDQRLRRMRIPAAE